MLSLSKDIKLIITDFDGVITDGFLYVSAVSEEQSKKVNFKDIMGISLAVKNGYKVAIVSGEKNKVVDFIANKFDLQDVHQGIKDKIFVVKNIIEKYSLSPSAVLYIGDDINDIEALKYVGTAITVPDANYKVKNIENIITTKAPAGNGAFREVIDSLLNTRRM